MSKRKVDLSDDGEFAQPVAHDEFSEKPKRKRGESRGLSARLIAVMIGAAVVVMGMALILWTMEAPRVAPTVMPQVTAVALGAVEAPPTCNRLPPQGERIAYVAADSSIHFYTPQTGADCILVSFLGDNLTEIALSADGTRVAYTRSEQGGAVNDIWVMNADGTGGLNVTPTHDSYARYPAWSPDGTRIAFTAIIDNAPNIAVMNADGSNVLTLAQGAQPAWSSDGARIAFVSGDGARSFLMVMNADGTNARRVTNSDASESHPRWSPDGASLMFSRAVDDQYKEVYSVVVDDPLREHRLIAQLDDLIYDLAWLPGERFAYVDAGQTLHTRPFPPNDGASGDALVLSGALSVEWWTPPA